MSLTAVIPIGETCTSSLSFPLPLPTPSTTDDRSNCGALGTGRQNHCLLSSLRDPVHCCLPNNTSHYCLCMPYAVQVTSHTSIIPTPNWAGHIRRQIIGDLFQRNEPITIRVHLTENSLQVWSPLHLIRLDLEASRSPKQTINRL